MFERPIVKVILEKEKEERIKESDLKVGVTYGSKIIQSNRRFVRVKIDVKFKISTVEGAASRKII